MPSTHSAIMHLHQWDGWLQLTSRPATFNAGLHTVKLQQLYLHDAAPTIEALASLPHLRTLDLT